MLREECRFLEIGNYGYANRTDEFKRSA